MAPREVEWQSVDSSTLQASPVPLSPPKGGVVRSPKTRRKGKRDALFNKIFFHDGFMFYRHDPVNTAPCGSVPSMFIHVSSIVGEPRAQLVMWNPRDRSEFWHSPGFTELKLGVNIVSLGAPTQQETWFTYSVVLGKGDAISINKFVACSEILLGDENQEMPLTISHDGVDDGWELL